uniref:hypothetical protein n=1 Tax=uncultured Halomonas sp. TaxID=173971 RepID=UPI00260CDC39|nr:hypothetical protein [uncultured Halomonas sp.]
MKIFLHIGTHKTGSTFIQEILKKSHDALKNNGVYYPVDGYSQAGHHELAWAVMKNDSVSAKKYLEDALYKASGCSCIVFSSEEFEFIKNIGLLKTLLKGHEVELVCYFRRQDNYLESEYNQHVKMISTKFKYDIFMFYMYYDFHRRFNYMALMESWRKQEFISRFHVFSYDKVVRDSSLVDSFFSFLGVSYNFIETIEFGKKSNESIPASSLIYLSRLNAIDGVSQGDRNLFIKKIQEEMSKKNKSASNKKECFLSQEYSSRLVNRFHGSNNKLAKNYCGGEELFDTVTPDNHHVVVDFYNDFDRDFYLKIIEKLNFS